MTVKQAVVYNVVSALIAYLGLVVGIFAGEYDDGRQYVLSITAGLFLYVALADMVSYLFPYKTWFLSLHMAGNAVEFPISGVLPNSIFTVTRNLRCD